LGFYEATRISAKSEWMQNEIVRIYNVPKEKISVIAPNTASWIKEMIELYNTVSGGADSK